MPEVVEPATGEPESPQSGLKVTGHVTCWRGAPALSPLFDGQPQSAPRGVRERSTGGCRRRPRLPHVRRVPRPSPTSGRSEHSAAPEECGGWPMAMKDEWRNPNRLRGDGHPEHYGARYVTPPAYPDSTSRGRSAQLLTQQRERTDPWHWGAGGSRNRQRGNAREATSPREKPVGRNSVTAETVRCARCGLDLSVRVFRANRRKRNGLNSWCNACHVSRTRQWGQEHRDEILARRRAWYAEHVDAEQARRTERQAELRQATLAEMDANLRQEFAAEGVRRR
jgi:hypothetical protein